jgi:hypothetical protein
MLPVKELWPSFQWTENRSRTANQISVDGGVSVEALTAEGSPNQILGDSQHI